eukprot:7915064-Karenia_brevis.AAC.1
MRSFSALCSAACLCKRSNSASTDSGRISFRNNFMRRCGPGGGPCAKSPGEKGWVMSTFSLTLARESPTYAATMSESRDTCAASRQSAMTACNEAPWSMWAVALKSGTA